MRKYVILIRGINVGGKNKIPMADLKACLEKRGFTDFSTYIASGNVILKSDLATQKVKTTIERAISESFELDTAHIKVLVLTHKQLQSVIDNKPQGFGEQPDMYHSDAIFLMDAESKEAMKVFNPREGVDTVW